MLAIIKLTKSVYPFLKGALPKSTFKKKNINLKVKDNNSNQRICYRKSTQNPYWTSSIRTFTTLTNQLKDKRILIERSVKRMFCKSKRISFEIFMYLQIEWDVGTLVCGNKASDTRNYRRQDDPWRLHTSTLFLYC